MLYLKILISEKISVKNKNLREKWEYLYFFKYVIYTIYFKIGSFRSKKIFKTN